MTKRQTGTAAAYPLIGLIDDGDAMEQAAIDRARTVLGEGPLQVVEIRHVSADWVQYRIEREVQR